MQSSVTKVKASDSINHVKTFFEFLTEKDKRTTGDKFYFTTKDAVTVDSIDEKRTGNVTRSNMKHMASVINNICDGIWQDMFFIHVYDITPIRRTYVAYKCFPNKDKLRCFCPVCKDHVDMFMTTIKTWVNGYSETEYWNCPCCDTKIKRDMRGEINEQDD